MFPGCTGNRASYWTKDCSLDCAEKKQRVRVGGRAQQASSSMSDATRCRSTATVWQPPRKHRNWLLNPSRLSPRQLNFQHRILPIRQNYMRYKIFFFFYKYLKNLNLFTITQHHGFRRCNHGKSILDCSTCLRFPFLLYSTYSNIIINLHHFPALRLFKGTNDPFWSLSVQVVWRNTEDKKEKHLSRE